jgi:hypothetical protein
MYDPFLGVDTDLLNQRVANEFAASSFAPPTTDDFGGILKAPTTPVDYTNWTPQWSAQVPQGWRNSNLGYMYNLNNPYEYKPLTVTNPISNPDNVPIEYSPIAKWMNELTPTEEDYQWSNKALGTDYKHSNDSSFWASTMPGIMKGIYTAVMSTGGPVLGGLAGAMVNSSDAVNNGNYTPMLLGAAGGAAAGYGGQLMEGLNFGTDAGSLVGGGAGSGSWLGGTGLDLAESGISGGISGGLTDNLLNTGVASGNGIIDYGNAAANLTGGEPITPTLTSPNIIPEVTPYVPTTPTPTFGDLTSITGVPGATDFADAGVGTVTDVGGGTAIDNLLNTGNTITNQTTTPTVLDNLLNGGGTVPYDVTPYTPPTPTPSLGDLTGTTTGVGAGATTGGGTGVTIGDVAGITGGTGAVGEGANLLTGGGTTDTGTTGTGLDMGDLWDGTGINTGDVTGGGTVGDESLFGFDTPGNDIMGTLKDIFGTDIIGGLSAGKLAALAALLGGSSYLSSNAQKGVSDDLWNKQQSANEANKQFWLQNAFPKASVVDAKRAAALADMNRKAETQKANLMDTMAGRGLGGGGIVAHGLTDIDKGSQQNYAKLANELTQFENTPLFNPPYASATTPQSYTTTAQSMADLVKALTAQYGGASIYKSILGDSSNNNSGMNNLLLQALLSGYGK